MQKQSRRWIIACVAAALLLSLVLVQIDNQQLYHTLQNRLEKSGITLKAKSYSLSPMHLGSIRLNHVTIHTHAFELQAERLFIDLDLAALLTGKALPQALYVQLADINIKKQQQEEWLQLIATDTFKLKRINISQSELHFVQQHITLKQVTLDVRDIGKNKNPRLELQAHIGEGRLDAHGSLRLKRGEITRGSGRLKIHDVPLSFLAHRTTLETLNGSITTHLNQDKTWQSFGHISLQTKQQNAVELRGKVTGTPNQLLNIEDIVLTIKDAGALQIKGGCKDFTACQINTSSNQLNMSSLFNLTNDVHTASNNILQKLSIDSLWDGSLLTSQGQIAWSELNYTLTNKQPNEEAKTVHLDAGKLDFTGFVWDNYSQWQLQSATLYDNKKEAVSFENVALNNQSLKLPMRFINTPLWLPISNILLDKLGQHHPVQGDGPISGVISLLVPKKLQSDNISAHFELDASNARISWQDSLKPKGIEFKLHGESSWLAESLLQAHVSIILADTNSTVDYQAAELSLQHLDINFDDLKEDGVILPTYFQAWHGDIFGHITLAQEDFKIKSANLELINFGIGKHHFSGAVQKQSGKWFTDQVAWVFKNNHAYISTSKRGQVNINAAQLDAEGLALTLAAPLSIQGKLSCDSLSLPFGTLKNVSAAYKLTNNNIRLKDFNSVFYEGSLKSKHISITPNEGAFSMTGPIQVGGIHLNNWNWIHKQFQNHLEGTVYATVNLDLAFNPAFDINHWLGDGDVMVYNGRWILNSKSMRADKFNLSMRKREQFNGTFKISNGQEHGYGKIKVDEEHQTSGFLVWQDSSYTLSKEWPHIKYEQAE